MVKRAVIGCFLACVVGGCFQKPEGPAERIGRSIDEISAALNDLDGSTEGERERIRRERDRREREAAARRGRSDGGDTPDPRYRDEFTSDEELDAEFGSTPDDSFDEPLADPLDEPAYPRRRPPVDRGETRY